MPDPIFAKPAFTGATPAADAADFVDLIAGDEAAALLEPVAVPTSLLDVPKQVEPAPVAAAIADSTFGQLRVEEFPAFDVHHVTPTEGEYLFAVEQKFLKEATAATGLATAGAHPYGTTNLTIYAHQLRLQTFNQAAFCEVFIPLTQHSSNPRLEPGHEISFVFDHAALAAVANTFPGAIINFRFAATTKMLHIEQGEVQAREVTFNQETFPDYHVKIGTKRLIGKVNPVILRQGVAYLQLFAQKDDVQANLSLIEVRDGAVIGGSSAALGSFSSPLFNNLKLKIKYEFIAPLEKMLARFNPERTFLLETDSYYILRDDNLCFGFERYAHSFRPFGKLLIIPSEAYVLVPRSQLLTRLLQIAVFCPNSDALVQLHVEGAGPHTQLHLTTRILDDAPSTTTLECSRQAHPSYAATANFPVWDLFLNIHAFIKIVTSFNSAHVQFEILGSKAVLVSDAGDGFEAKTLLAASTAEQVAKLKAVEGTDQARD